MNALLLTRIKLKYSLTNTPMETVYVYVNL